MTFDQYITRRPWSDIAISWSRNTGPSNASCLVDEEGPDGDATYVYTGTVDNIDEYDSPVDPSLIPDGQLRVYQIIARCCGKAYDPLGANPKCTVAFGLTNGSTYINFNPLSSFGSVYTTITMTKTRNPNDNTMFTLDQALIWDLYIMLAAKVSGTTARVTQLYFDVYLTQDTRPGRNYVSWTP